MNKPNYIDYLIVGAGPAGLQLAFHLDRAGKNYLVVEAAESAGSFFKKFPRHDKLISVNKVHTGYSDRKTRLRYDWNSLLCDDPDFAFTNYSSDYFPSAKDLVRYCQDYAARMGLRIRYKTRITDIMRCHDGYNFEVADQNGVRYGCRVLVMASGMRLPYTPNIPGIEHAENYVDFSVDPQDYVDQRVLILGKSNSAFETADNLTSTARVMHVCSPNPLQFAWQTHYIGNLRAVNNNFLDTYHLKGQNAVLDANVDRIERRGDEYVVDITFTHASGQTAQFAYDRVLVCTGFRWDHSIFPKHCKPEMTQCGRLPLMTSAWESTNQPHLFFAGTSTQMRDKHKTMSNVIHGFRHNVESLSKVLLERYENEPWPSTELARDPRAIADKVVDQVSTSAAILLQPGFLADVLTVHEDRAEYFENVAVDYIHEGPFSEYKDYYVITLEYGHSDDNPFAVNRAPDASQAHNDVYLHPVIRRYTDGKQVAEHHISESLENDWRRENHCGSSRLIRKMAFPGQDDPAMYQHTHFEKLVDFLRSQLDLVHQGQMCES